MYQVQYRVIIKLKSTALHLQISTVNIVTCKILPRPAGEVKIKYM